MSDTTTVNTISYLYVDNMKNDKENMRSIGIAKFGDKWMGFVKETSFIHSEGYITKKLEPILSSPAAAFREALEDAGLIGFQF